ncbi:MAG TPA: hypothetical protein VMM76_25805 [Pirellulaceae bacterium]|nr:hypothetical protein [Pirellulaceae bacterium]
MQNIRTSINCVFVAVLGLCMPCSADTISRVDLRGRVSEPSNYYVVICARESERWGSGHTFVVWVQQNTETGESHSQGFGFYPEVEKVVTRLFRGNGALRDESGKSASIKPELLTHRLIVQVDRRDFEAGLDVKERWMGSGGAYHLIRRNCTHFAYEVMQAIGLGASEPRLGERPSLYVARLMTLDLGRSRTGLVRLPGTLVSEQR